MPTIHNAPPLNPNFDRRPTRDEVLKRGAQLHAEQHTGGRAGNPQNYGGQGITQEAANVVNELMKKLPPAAVQFFVDTATMKNQLDQIRAIVGADSNADLVTWIRGMWSIQEDERNRWNTAVRDLADAGNAQRAIGYGGGDRMETQRALTSGVTHSGDPEKIIDAAFEAPKIAERDLRETILATLLRQAPGLTSGDCRDLAKWISDDLRASNREHFA